MRLRRAVVRYESVLCRATVFKGTGNWMAVFRKVICIWLLTEVLAHFDKVEMLGASKFVSSKGPMARVEEPPKIIVLLIISLFSPWLANFAQWHAVEI